MVYDLKNNNHVMTHVCFSKTQSAVSSTNGCGVAQSPLGTAGAAKVSVHGIQAIFRELVVEGSLLIVKFA